MEADPWQAKFGRAWLTFAVALAVHVLDEATHDFLSVYQPNAIAIRTRFPFLPVPIFTFRSWIISLGFAILVMLLLTPLAYQGKKWITTLAFPLGVVVGIANGTAHILSSIYLKKAMPGVLSAPLIICAGAWLVKRALAAKMEKARAARAF